MPHTLTLESLFPNFDISYSEKTSCFSLPSLRADSKEVKTVKYRKGKLWPSNKLVTKVQLKDNRIKLNFVSHCEITLRVHISRNGQILDKGIRKAVCLPLSNPAGFSKFLP